MNIYYLCNNKSLVSNGDNNSNILNYNNCSNVLINKLIIDNPQMITKINYRFRIGKYSFELKPLFNNAKYCLPNECPYLEDDTIFCDTCRKIVYFVDLANYKMSKTNSLINKPSSSEMTCLKNSKKYSKISSFLAVTTLDSYEIATFNPYQNNSIFNTNEAYIVNDSVSLSVSMELTSDSMCNPIDIYRVTEIADPHFINPYKTRNNILVCIGYVIVSIVGICFNICGFIWLLNCNLKHFCKFNFKFTQKTIILKLQKF